MSGIKGLNGKKTGSYADTARLNTQMENEALQKKIEAEAAEKKRQLEAQERMKENMILLAAQDLQVTPVEQQVTPVEQQVTPVEQQVAPVQATPVAKDEIKTKRKESQKSDPIVIFNEHGTIEFNGQFLIKDTKKKGEYASFGFSTPKDIGVEVKVKAARDGLSLFELNNLLYAMYLEKGFSKEFLERYKKSFND